MLHKIRLRILEFINLKDARNDVVHASQLLNKFIRVA
jgi:hypothetical protein